MAKPHKRTRQGFESTIERAEVTMVWSGAKNVFPEYLVTKGNGRNASQAIGQ